jgi:GxxExxY protein
MSTKQHVSNLEFTLTGAFIEVHRSLGPGLLESVYHKCLAYELDLLKIKYVSQLTIPINYKGITIDTQLRPDFIVEDCIVIELKSVETIQPVHDAQLLTYMKLLKIPKGILVNFNCTNIVKNGKKSLVNEFYKRLL